MLCLITYHFTAERSALSHTEKCQSIKSTFILERGGVTLRKPLWFLLPIILITCNMFILVQYQVVTPVSLKQGTCLFWPIKTKLLLFIPIGMVLHTVKTHMNILKQ